MGNRNGIEPTRRHWQQELLKPYGQRRSMVELQRARGKLKA
jgi:hypothetical protein